MSTYALAMIALTLSIQAAAPNVPWFRRALVGMEVGPTGAQFGHSDPKDARYCARMDGREIVERCARAGCDYVVVWARDGDYAYYDSKLLAKAPGLKGDPLRDAVAEGRKRHLPILAYCVVQQGGHYLDAHPELEMRGADGKPLGRFCYNSGYLEKMKGILSEELAYGIDGFHVDMIDQGFGAPYGCWCPSCRALFEKETGHPMPPGATWDSRWDEMLEFRYRSSAGFEQALRDYVHHLKPDATIDFNYHGSPPFSFEVGQRPVQHAGNGDFVTGETGQWGFSALGVGLNAEFYRAATPGIPVQVAMQRGVRMYHDQTTRPLEDLRWELYNLLAHGAFVTMVDKLAFDGTADPVAYERIGQAFADAKRHRAEFGQPPVSDVGLYFSARSRDWYGREDPGRYFEAFQGAAKACTHEHLTYGVLFDEDLSAATLRRFPIVCLPNTAILSPREIDLFRAYVEGGGRMLVTGQSGLYDRLGAPAQGSDLETLIGARATGRLDAHDNWLEMQSGGDLLGLKVPPDWKFLVSGPAAIYAPTTAKPFGRLWKPYRTTRQQEGREGADGRDWPMSAESPVGPAILENHIGRGTVLTIAAAPDFATASEHGVVEARKLFTAAVRYLAPEPRVRISAPANVEAVVTDDPSTRTVRVHFIAYNSLPQTTPSRNRPYVVPGLAEDPPLYRAVVSTAFPVRSARVLRASTHLTKERTRVSLTINDIHECLVLKY